MRKLVLLLGITALLTFTGCTKEPAEGPKEPEQDQMEEEGTGTPPKDETLPEEKEPEPEPIVRVLKTINIASKSSDEYDAKTTEFNIGDKEYLAASGKSMPYSLRGVMAVPKGEGPFPLVLVMHGSHSNEDESLRFDTGFTYLVESLAKRGYIAISLDMSKAYIWKYGDSDDKEKVMYLADEHLQSLEEANSGKNAGYPIELTGKIDFSKIALIGHSRGGDTIFDIALEQQKKGRQISALLAVAPVQPLDIETKEWPESDVAVLVPEYDGDVVSLDGFMINTVLEEKLNRRHGITYLLRANHNYFNSNITVNDALLARTEDELSDQLTAEEQQFFLDNYAKDFLQASFTDITEGTVYDISEQHPDTMYDFDVITRLTDKTNVVLADADMESALEKQGAAVKAVKDSWFYEEDEIEVDTVTFGNGPYKTRRLLSVQWSSREDSIAFKPKSTDFSGFQSICLNMLPDSADEQYAPETASAPGFTLELKDQSGKLARVTLSEGSSSMRITPGKMDMTPIGDTEYQFWIPMTPIGEIRIPLTLFEGVDLSAIERVSILFDQSDKGSVFLEKIRIQ